MAIDGELRLSIEDGEHFFHRIVEVLRDTAAWLHLATKDEVQVHIHGTGGNEGLTFSQTDTAMRVRGLDLAQVGVPDALRERRTGSRHLRKYCHGHEHCNQQACFHNTPTSS
jgi:hypothetical protein